MMLHAFAEKLARSQTRHPWRYLAVSLVVTIAAGLALMSADVPFANRMLHEVRARLPADENGELPRWMIPAMILGAVFFTSVSVWWTFIR